MASKAFPALVLLMLVCGQLVVDGHAQTYIGGGGGIRGGGSAAGLRPPTYTATHGHSSTIGEYRGARRPSAVEEEKAFMVNSLPAHDRPLPVPPSGH
ncbi:hypothetical protein ZWY2020_037033 [Hordeum vulgare]|nr:hypothetical protein ZWY2020_037033 [Hordeum vulgare]